MLTIFTPTYNRAYILPRLYESLLKQTNKEFEWIIIDDGSTDNTKDLANIWINENKINIKYFFQENQGKPIAHNVGIEKSSGEIVTCVDSDDYLTEEAVEIILKKWNQVKETPICVGMVGIVIYEDGTPVGTKMPNIEYSTCNELYNKHKYKGDTILIYKKSIIQNYTFPKIEGEKFIPETYLYDQIDQIGKLAIIQDGVYICEYLDDGYTKNVRKLIANNPKGYKLWAEQRLKLIHGLKQQYITASKYVLGALLAKEKHYVKNSPKKCLTILAIPCAVYIYYKKYKNKR